MIGRVLCCVVIVLSAWPSAVWGQARGATDQTVDERDIARRARGRGAGTAPNGDPLPPAPPLSPSATSGIPRGYAVVIGVSTYPRLPKDKQLRFAEKDAEAVYRALISSEAGAFAPENVHLLLGEKAKLADIRREIEQWLPSVAGPSDRVVVYFAGHGYVEDAVGYFAPYDVDPDRLPTTGYAMKTLGRVMATNVRARWKVLLADACHSAKVNPETTNEKLDRQLATLSTNFLTLTAASRDESSHDDSALSTGYGFFTYFLERALHGDADSNPCDGRITAGEVVTFVGSRVREYARTRPKPVVQTPAAFGGYDPEMLLGVNPRCRSVQDDYGTATVEVNLDDVQLFIDGRLIGSVSKSKPLRVPGLPVGPHEFKGVAPGYEPDIKTVLIAPGQNLVVTLRIRYQRSYKRSAIDLGEQGDRLLNTIRSASNPINILPIARRQSEGDLRRAQALYTRALADDPKYAVAAYRLGEVHQLLGQQDEALAALRKAIDIDAVYVEAQTQLAAILIERGDTEEAIRQLNQALRLESKNDDVLTMLSRAYIDRGVWSSAVEYAERALAINDTYDLAHLWRAEAKRQLAVLEKTPATRDRLFGQARASYLRFLDLTNFESSKGSLLAFHFLGHGIGSRRHANREESYIGLRMAGFSGLCIAENRAGVRARALDYCKRALDYDRRNPITYFLLGNVYRDMYHDDSRCEHLRDASRNYQTMVSINPDLVESKNARNYLEQITGILPKTACAGA